AATDAQARALLITGNGPTFSAGGDLEKLSKTADAGASLVGRSPNEPSDFFNVLPDVPPEYRSRYTFAMAIPKPVICAVNGLAIGAGLVLTLSCDIRIASTEAAFAAGFARIGATPEIGMSWTLPRLIGDGRAREMMLSGRRVGAEEALAIGLVSQIVAPEDLRAHATDYARDLASKISPRSVGVIKRHMRHVHHQTFAEAFAEGAADARETFASDDFKEGLAAMREKRPPRFS